MCANLDGTAYHTPRLYSIPPSDMWFIAHQTVVMQRVTVSQAPCEEGQGLGALLTKKLRFQ